MKKFTKIFILTQIFIFFYAITYAQVDCEDDVLFKKDEFTNEISISTIIIKIYDPTGKHMINSVIDDNDNAVDWNLRIGFLFFKNNAYLVFRHLAKERYNDVYVNKAYLKLSDESVVELTDGIKGKLVQTDAYWSYNDVLFTINTSDLKKLNNFTISKFKVYFENQPRESVVEKELNIKDAEKIRNISKCLYDKIPTTSPYVAVNNTTTEISKPVEENSQISTNEPSPTNDTSSISLYKQWKRLATLDSTGSPTDMNSTLYFTFHSDGTYLARHFMTDGKAMENTGKFQLLNDNKLIVFTQDGLTKSSSSVVVKLSNKELVLKGKSYQSFYVVY